MTKQKTKVRKQKKVKVPAAVASAKKARVSPIPGGVKVVVYEGTMLLMQAILKGGTNDDGVTELEQLTTKLAEHGVKLSRGQLAVCSRALGKVRGRGRPRVKDPRTSTHLQLNSEEREMCFAASKVVGLAFSSWSRMVLLTKAREILRSDLPAPSGVSIHT